MTLIHESVENIAAAFPGCEITAIAPIKTPGWPIEYQLATAIEGELWVSEDIAALYFNKSQIVYGKNFTSVDVCEDGTEKVRAYRCLDRDWYAWLLHALKKAQDSLDEETWQQRTQRFNEIWSIARRWWTAETIKRIHQNPINYIPANYQPVTPAKDVVARFKARTSC